VDGSDELLSTILARVFWTRWTLRRLVMVMFNCPIVQSYSKLFTAGHALLMQRKQRDTNDVLPLFS